MIIAAHSPVRTLRNLCGRYSDQRSGAITPRGSRGTAISSKQAPSDGDLANRVSLLGDNHGVPETGGGCFDGHNPPPNPFYQYEVTGLERPRP